MWKRHDHVNFTRIAPSQALAIVPALRSGGDMLIVSSLSCLIKIRAEMKMRLQNQPLRKEGLDGVDDASSQQLLVEQDVC